MTTQQLSCPGSSALEPSSRHVANRAADAVPAQPRQARVLRFATLTAFGAPANFVIYAALLHLTGFPADRSTLIAALAVIIPKFMVSKLWVWKDASRDKLGREASVYLAVTAFSLTMAVVVAHVLEAQGATNSQLLGANVTLFGVMWWMRFVVLDRFAFVAGRDLPFA